MPLANFFHFQTKFHIQTWELPRGGSFWIKLNVCAQRETMNFLNNSDTKGNKY